MGIRSLLRRSLGRACLSLNRPVIDAMKNDLHRRDRFNAQLQLLLSLEYRRRLHEGLPLPAVRDVGFRVYSETDEDGILHFIFSVAGAPNRKCVDIGSATIEGSNTANLVVNHGWAGLLIDASETSVRIARHYYTTCPDTCIYPPVLVHAWVTAENVNDLLSQYGFTGEIDLLSIDIDGVDYWVWKAIQCVSPRVVLVEYQCIWGPEKAVTVPYRPDFQAVKQGEFGVYSGASLVAFVKLARRKGYRLVGCQRYGYNAFFVRNDVGQGVLPEVSAESCLDHPFVKWAREAFSDAVVRYEWVEV